jgi:hypothetical protein
MVRASVGKMKKNSSRLWLLELSGKMAKKSVHDVGNRTHALTTHTKFIFTYICTIIHHTQHMGQKSYKIRAQGTVRQGASSPTHTVARRASSTSSQRMFSHRPILVAPFGLVQTKIL